MTNDKKEYIERGALIDSIENCYYLYGSTDRETVRQAIENAPAADVAPVVHGERKFGGLDFDGVDEILKKHRAFVMATINGHGCHIGTYKKIALEADGDWIIDVDVESLDVTGQGDFASEVYGEWIDSHVPGSALSECSLCHYDCGAYTMKFCPMCGHPMKWNGGTKQSVSEDRE